MRSMVIVAALLVSGCSQEPAPSHMPWDEARQNPGCAGRLTYYQPENGVLSTEALAKKVAYHYLRDAFPEDDQLDSLQANLRNGFWHVAGTPTAEDYNVVHVLLCQSNGRVLAIWATNDVGVRPVADTAATTELARYVPCSTHFAHFEAEA